jgi:hypothetical protein
LALPFAALVLGVLAPALAGAAQSVAALSALAGLWLEQELFVRAGQAVNIS